MTAIVALYARVSSEKQAQADTIASQIAALEKRIQTEGYTLTDACKFIDNGYSGSNLNRPALEQLRDKAAGGEVDRIYIHSPDRLSRRYAYQMLLLEEFQKGGAEIIFLNHQTNDSPESHLLLQMQGMVAEYERAKIMERYRRGKIHAAQKGRVNVLAGAPYGYRYIDKYRGAGQALYEVHEAESAVVQTIFSWVGQDRLTIGEVCRRLKEANICSPKGKPYWDRSVIWLLLQNPAYKGQAAFGKTKIGAMLPRIRPQKHSCEQPRKNYSVHHVEKENWIYVPVPALIDEALFDTVQEQLSENRKLARTRRRGAAYLLQGLLVCQGCKYAYYGKSIRNKRGEKIQHYAYYRCIGADPYRFGGNKICENKQIRTDTLEIAVWEEVKHLLKNPNSLTTEYQRRLSEIEQAPLNQKSSSLDQQAAKLQRGISRLIDSYTQEYIGQEEFEPRIKAMKCHLKNIEEQKQKILDQRHLKNELTLVMTRLEQFASAVKSKLEEADWSTKRDLIRTLVKRIEINQEDVNLVFRIKELASSNEGQPGGSNQESLQHCCRRISTSAAPNFFLDSR
jgi:site-specific DNA recombinase